MFKRMKWEDAYRLWNDGCYDFTELLSSPATSEPVLVNTRKMAYKTAEGIEINASDLSQMGDVAFYGDLEDNLMNARDSGWEQR